MYVIENKGEIPLVNVGFLLNIMLETPKAKSKVV